MHNLVEDIIEDDRRSHARKMFALDVHVFPGFDGDADPIKVKLKDLSLLGMAIYASDQLDLQPGDELRICLSPSANEEDNINMRRLIHARVAHNDGEIVGLAFESLGIEVLDFMHVLLKNIRLF